MLGVREPETNGILVVGSNPVALMVATSLKEQGFDVVVAHNNYTNIAGARMSGLRTYFGNPISDHADHHLDLIGIGHLFAMSMDREMNTLSEIHYRHEFGERSLYRLKFSEEKVKSERDDKQANFSSQWLFGKDVTYTKLASMLSRKAKIKITNITDSYSFEQYKADNKQFVPLYTIDKEGKLHVITDKFDGTVARDRKLIALVVEDEVQPKAVDVTAKQEKARVVADAHFEANSKTPEKRREKILSDSDKANDNNSESVGESFNDSTDQKATLSTTAIKDNLAANIQSKLNAVKVAESTVINIDTNDNNAKQKKTQSSEPKSSESDTVQAQTPKADDELVSTKNTSANAIAAIKSKANGSGSAPKTKKGTLDPKRLPDSDDRINEADQKDDTVKVEALYKMTLDKE